MNADEIALLKSHVRSALSAVEQLERLLEDEGRLPRKGTRDMVMVADAWHLVDDAARKLMQAGQRLHFTPDELTRVDY